ncbi:PI-PLC X domain-containing protein 3 [Phlebotomus argentipes]|uniref:PI-PLC X domain-containing protein 3 n=1 Tax=Phlebotomus argentipes TaxID=94469 RepID=UPI0028929E32|nr:PI-PLC X domain-containing protein 3 [Phlebotomus argentipes]XP_059615204.1 PI-PLC X domain-containing protein 3 [Phlebotomus argentipes]XP_059615205.1 PI-PLC X domain-containing protein 3 [Phlebotomus argentipes]XP_059615206.1 PI-PLC X domain-containing protein 3 [Phlebotomus argentipes]
MLTTFWPVISVLALLSVATAERAASTELRDDARDMFEPRLAITVSAKHHRVEVSWYYSSYEVGDIIVVTNEVPNGSFRRKNIQEPVVEAVREGSGLSEAGSGSGNGDLYEPGLLSVIPLFDPVSSYEEVKKRSRNVRNNINWQYGPNYRDVLVEMYPQDKQGWATTDIIFDRDLVRQVNRNTTCYGYWATILRKSGRILMTRCFRAFPTWMNDLRRKIENLRFKDLFIPGTHDSSSYMDNFHPHNETVVTKYSLTQDDDIRTQLLHGIRYLDIRVGYYRASKPQFWANHGISRQHPLQEILQQIKDFVQETNEIVIVDIQEFPVGFGKTKDIHRLLVNFLQQELKGFLVEPGLTWRGTLKQMWSSRKNIVLAYDKSSVVYEFGSILFESVEQRWPNKQTLDELRRHMTFSRNQMTGSFGNRPWAEMAELTPSAWGVITDLYGGLRRMADDVNRHVSRWYASDFGAGANVVALDFYRGTTIIETALRWNAIKTVS